MKRSLLAFCAVACMAAAAAVTYVASVAQRVEVTWRRTVAWLADLGTWLVSHIPRRHDWWVTWYRAPRVAAGGMKRLVHWLRPRVSTRWKMVPST